MSSCGNTKNTLFLIVWTLVMLHYGGLFLKIHVCLSPLVMFNMWSVWIAESTVVSLMQLGNNLLLWCSINFHELSLQVIQSHLLTKLTDPSVFKAFLTQWS